MEKAIELLYAIDPSNIAPEVTEADREAGRKIKKVLLRRIDGWMDYAKHKLATTYLLPEDRQKKRRARRIYDLTFKPIVDRIQQIGEQERATEEAAKPKQKLESAITGSALAQPP
jgi:hypothetical protein